MTSTLRLPKGYSDFQKLRQAGLHYVDKSLLVEQVLNDSAEIILLPRPRRFGKTLNLSMLRYFFEKTNEERRSLFTGLKIEQSADVWQHFQRYPTIFITFKDIKELNWQEAYNKIVDLIADLYNEQASVLQLTQLDEFERQRFEALRQRKASHSDVSNSLRILCKILRDVYNERVVLLIDEYDTPIHAAFEYSYYDEAIAFFRGLLSAALKDNVHVFRGVMTGILRIAKESIFSGLNNLGVYSLLLPEYSDFFGFTENEVQELVKLAAQPELIDSIRTWYNGYNFGERVIYNPWSVNEFLMSQDKIFRAYWVNTSTNATVRQYILENPNDLRPEFEQLLHGEALDRPIYENISLPDLKSNRDMVWSLLLFSGYLKSSEFYSREDRPWVKLIVPNREVNICFTDLVRSWFNEYVSTASSHVQQLLKAMLQGDEETLYEALQAIVRDNASYHDAKEQFFHGLVLGLLVNLSDTHEVHSNRESGFGRCDVLISPKRMGAAGIALEFKVVNKRKKETMKQALTSAMKQLRERNYASTLLERGASPIYIMAIAFEGKRVEIQIKTWPLRAHHAKKLSRLTKRASTEKPTRSTNTRTRTKK